MRIGTIAKSSIRFGEAVLKHQEKSVASALRACTHALNNKEASMRDLHVVSLVLATLNAIRAMRENADGSSSHSP